MRTVLMVSPARRVGLQLMRLLSCKISTPVSSVPPDIGNLHLPSPIAVRVLVICHPVLRHGFQVGPAPFSRSWGGARECL